MTTKQKAKQLALTLVGEDQNPQPLIEVLVEMAEWSKNRYILVMKRLLKMDANG